MRKAFLFLAVLLAASAAYAEFPEEIKIKDKTIPCLPVEEARKLGFECEDIPWQGNGAKFVIEAIGASPEKEFRSTDRALEAAVKDLDLGDYADGAKEYLDGEKAVFDLLKKVDAAPKYQFPIGRSASVATVPLAHLAHCQRFARDLRLKAALDFTDDKRAEAVDDMMLGMRLGRRMGGEPFLISGLVGIAMQGISSNALQTMIASGRMTDAELLMLARALKDAAPPDVVKCFRGERTMGLGAVEEVRKDPGQIRGWAAAMGEEEKTSFAEQMLDVFTFDAEESKRNLTAFYDFLDAWVKKPTSEAFLPENRVDKYVAEHKAKWDVLTRLLTPAMEKARSAWARDEVQIASLRIRVALERYKLAKKAYPKTLAELVPAFADALPMDPFTGKPFGYRLEEDGSFTFWSVGEDLKDDGGHGDPKRFWDGADYVFTSRPAEGN